jgi:hypothetical protein
MIRPGHLDHQLIAGIGAETGDSVKLRDIEVEAHLVELEYRPWSQTIPTGLVARVLLLLYEGYVETIAGHPIGGRRTGGTAADNENRG